MKKISSHESITHDWYEFEGWTFRVDEHETIKSLNSVKLKKHNITHNEKLNNEESFSFYEKHSEMEIDICKSRKSTNRYINTEINER